MRWHETDGGIEHLKCQRSSVVEPSDILENGSILVKERFHFLPSAKQPAAITPFTPTNRDPTGPMQRLHRALAQVSNPRLVYNICIGRMNELESYAD